MFFALFGNMFDSLCKNMKKCKKWHFSGDILNIFTPRRLQKCFKKYQKLKKTHEFWKQHFPHFWTHFGAPGGSVFEGCLKRNACFKKAQKNHKKKKIKKNCFFVIFNCFCMVLIPFVSCECCIIIVFIDFYEHHLRQCILFLYLMYAGYNASA